MSRKLSPRLTATASETTRTARTSLGSNARESPAGSLGRVGATVGLGTASDGASGGAAMVAVAAVAAEAVVGLNADVGSGVSLVAEVGRGAIVRAGMVFSGGVFAGNAVGVITTPDVGVVTGGTSVGAGWAEQPTQTSTNVRSTANACLTTEILIGPQQTSPVPQCIVKTLQHSIWAERSTLRKGRAGSIQTATRSLLEGVAASKRPGRQRRVDKRDHCGGPEEVLRRFFDARQNYLSAA